jgi:hypothetical protein
LLLLPKQSQDFPKSIAEDAVVESSPPGTALRFCTMQEYDAALKNILTRGSAGFLSRLMGLEVAQFLNSDLPQVRSQRADLLGEATDGRLFHVELQSTNDDRMASECWITWWRLSRSSGGLPSSWFCMWAKRP